MCGFRISGVTCFCFSSISFLYVYFCRFGGNPLQKKETGVKSHFTHTHTSNLPSITLSPHDTTLPPPTQRSTSSYTRLPLAPFTPQHYTPTSHPHPPHGVSENFVKLCSRHIPLRDLSAPAYPLHRHLSVNPQPWRCTNDSLGVPHAHSLSVCLFLEVVSRV